MSRIDEINARADAAERRISTYSDTRRARHDNQLQWRNLDSFQNFAGAGLILLGVAIVAFTKWVIKTYNERNKPPVSPPFKETPRRVWVDGTKR